MTARTKVSVWITGAVLAFVAAISIASSSQVHAAEIIEDGGTPSGSTGSYYTTYGFGWYSFNVNSSVGPEAWSSGGPWDTVRNRCENIGANRVVAFIIQRDGGDNSGNLSKVYKWESGGYSTSWTGYKGNSGGGWLSVSEAERRFNTLSNPSGYSFGSDVAWFCYNDYNYDLSPTISVENTVEPGTTTAPTGSVLNSGSTGTPSSIQWKITTFYLDPGVTTIPRATGGSSSAQPAAYYNNGAARGVNETTHRVNQTFSRSAAAQAVSIPGQQVGDLAVGSRVCFALSIQPRRHDNTEWRHSAPACAIVAKKPKVQVTGGDLSVGKAFSGQTAAVSDIVTSRTTRTLGGTSRTFGAWSEYGARATGEIIGLGTGSAYSGGLVGGTICGANLLTFSNTNGTSCAARQRLGHYSNLKTIPSVAAAFSVSNSTPTFSSLADATQRRVVKAQSNTSIGTGTIQRGDWLVINASGQTVTITGNISYADNLPLESIADIPQLVIIADRININAGVERIDAWLVANGTNGVINTCADVPNLHAGVCQNQLVVNGPVMAKSLQLRRTHGANNAGDAARAAEVFNLRPDAYLWSIARAQSANKVQSVYTRELPPRF